MGGILACCAGQALCCAGSLCCSLLCKPCSAAGVAAKNFSKIGYTVFQLFWIVASLVVMFNADHLQWMATKAMLDCPPEMDLTDSLCFGTSLLLRMSFALLLFHTLVFVLILGRNEAVAAFHDGCWGFKVLLLGAIYVGSFWLPNHFFIVGYLKVSKYASTFFLIYQALLMLVVAYKVNDQFVSNYNRDSTNCSAAILVAVTALLVGVNIFWIVRQFKIFSCGYNFTIMSVTLVGVMAMYGLVFLRSRKDASVLTSGVASLYCLYLQWSALSSDHDGSCNSNLGDKQVGWLQIGLGLFFTMVSLFVISGSTHSDDETLANEMGAHMMEKKEDLDERPEEGHLKRSAQRGSLNAEQSHVFAVSSATILFQFLLMLSSVYYAMVCTNWGELYVFREDGGAGEATGNSAFWLKIVSQWVTMSLYIFSLLAPVIFPDRHFD